jgi:hypothetical protein
MESAAEPLLGANAIGNKNPGGLMFPVRPAAVVLDRPDPRPATIRLAVVVTVLLALLTTLLLAAWPAAAATQLLRVTPADKAEFLRLRALIPEMRDCGAISDGKIVEFPGDEARAAELKSLGFAVEVAVPDLESFYASRLGSRDDFGLYHTYTEAVAAMDALMAAHPAIMTRQSIGTTLQGRTIWVYKISDNPGVDENEPEIFFNAYIHAREPITFEVLYDLAQFLVNGYGSDPRATTLVNSREIFLEPVVNPDGVEYNRQTDPNGGGLWRKNRRANGDGSFGVDLNRNFSKNWGYDDQGSSPFGSDETYRGTGPFSEPETQAMRDFVVARHFKTAVSMHSYGGYHLFSPGHTDIHWPDYDETLELGRMRRAAAGGYNTATAWEILYATNGDANDWMTGEELAKPKILSFITEMGTQNDGFWPAESRIPALLAENREPNLRLVEYADNPYRIMPPGCSAIASPDTVGNGFTLTWSVPSPDADNPAVAWNLIEATGASVGQDNLEGANQNRWTADGWSWSTARSHSATHSFWGGNANNLNNVLVSRRGHLVKPGEQLKFWTWYRMENQYDYGYVEVATDARNFVAIPGSITTTSDPNQRNLGNGITGVNATWTQATFNLSAYVGQVIWVRFRYNTDGFTTDTGWYVDDIEPSDLFVFENAVASNLGQAQYTFSSHALGTFSYLVQSVDAEGQTAVWSPPKTLVVTAVSGLAGGLPTPSWGGLEVLGANPARDEARFGFTVPVPARVGDPLRLSLHDVSGRVVAMVRDGSIGGYASPGRLVEDRLDVSSLPAGLYFARLEAGGRISERKLVVIR